MDGIFNDLTHIIGQTPLLALVLVLAGGVITSLGPCNMAMVPIIMAYVGGKEQLGRRQGFWLSLFFTLGSATTFVLLGVVIALVGGLFGPVKTILYYLVAAVCIMVALNLLHVWQLNLPVWTNLLARVQDKSGRFGAYLMGLVMGLAGSQCGTPVLLAILSIVMLKGNMIYGAVLLFAYALGRGVPVILAGTFTGMLKNMDSIGRWSYVLEMVAGLVLLGIGGYFIWIA